MTELCPHGRPTTTPLLFMFAGVDPCDDCAANDWVAARTPTLVATGVLLAIATVCALLVAGVFW